MPVEIGHKYILQRDIFYGGQAHPFMKTVCAGTVVTVIGCTNDVHVIRSSDEYDSPYHGLPQNAFFIERGSPYNKILCHFKDSLSDIDYYLGVEGLLLKEIPSDKTLQTYNTLATMGGKALCDEALKEVLSVNRITLMSEDIGDTISEVIDHLKSHPEHSSKMFLDEDGHKMVFVVKGDTGYLLHKKDGEVQTIALPVHIFYTLLSKMVA